MTENVDSASTTFSYVLSAHIKTKMYAVIFCIKSITNVALEIEEVANMLIISHARKLYKMS